MYLEISIMTERDKRPVPDPTRSFSLPDSSSSANRRAVQTAQAHRTAHEIVSAAIGLASLTGGGYWLDRRFDLLPVLTITGACLGFLTAGTSLKALLRRLDRESALSKQRANSKK